MSQWEKITISLPETNADIAAEFIISATGRGVETDYIAPDQQGKAGNLVRITAWLTQEEMDQGLYDHIERLVSRLSGQGMPSSAHYVIKREQQADEEWAEKWKEFFKPVRAGEHFIIRPHWESCKTGADDIEIIIDPGQAFGVGTHASTSLMLTAMEQLWKKQGSGYLPEVLDIGTGTGILGIAACTLGASRVRGIDIDLEAVSIAGQNAITNGVADVFSSDATPLDQIDREFDLVLANIDKPTLTKLSGLIANVTMPSGMLMVSGILTDQKGDIIKLFRNLGFEDISISTGSGAGDSGNDEWACVVLRRSEGT